MQRIEIDFKIISNKANSEGMLVTNTMLSQRPKHNCISNKMEKDAFSLCGLIRSLTFNKLLSEVFKKKKKFDKKRCSRKTSPTVNKNRVTCQETSSCFYVMWYFGDTLCEPSNTFK